MKALTPPRLLAVPVAVILAMPGCRKSSEARADPEWWKLETERVELAHRVELLEMRLSKIESRDGDFVEIEAQLNRDVERRAVLKEKAELLKAEVASRAEKFEGDRSDRLRTARGAAVGRSFDSLAGLKGRAYEDVVITRVTDIGIEFRHATGSARLPASQLTTAQQDSFGLDPRVAGTALQEEKAIATAYGSWVDDRVATSMALKEEKEAAAAVAAAAVVRSRPATTVASVSDETSSRTRLRDEPRSFGRSYTTWYPNYGRDYYYGYGSGHYCYPSYTPNVRVPTTSWGVGVPRSSGCYTPVAPRVSTSTSIFPIR